MFKLSEFVSHCTDDQLFQLSDSTLNIMRIFCYHSELSLFYAAQECETLSYCLNLHRLCDRELIARQQKAESLNAPQNTSQS